MSILHPWSEGIMGHHLCYLSLSTAAGHMRSDRDIVPCVRPLLRKSVLEHFGRGVSGFSMSTCTPLKCHRTSSSGFQHPGILQVEGLLEARSFRIAVSSHTRQVLHPGCSLVPTVCYGCATQSVPQIIPSSAPRAPCSRMRAILVHACVLLSTESPAMPSKFSLRVVLLCCFQRHSSCCLMVLLTRILKSRCWSVSILP